MTMLEWRVMEERHSPGGGPVPPIDANRKYGPCVYVDYRHTLIRHTVRTRWSLLDLETFLNVVGTAAFISVGNTLLALYGSSRG